MSSQLPKQRAGAICPRERGGVDVELCVFRHGRTVWNALGRYQGHADVDLDELGRSQALAVAQRCRAMHPVGLYSSDLRRCSDVAHRIAPATALTVDLDARLRERDIGQWSGLTRNEVADRYPDDFRAWREGDESVRPGGGETAFEMENRIRSFIGAVRATHKGGAVVAITHAGWIRSAMQWVLGDRVSRRSLGVAAQGSLTVFSLHANGDITLEAFNDRGHLLGVEPIDQEPPAPMVY